MSTNSRLDTPVILEAARRVTVIQHPFLSPEFNSTHGIQSSIQAVHTVGANKYVFRNLNAIKKMR